MKKLPALAALPLCTLALWLGCTETARNPFVPDGGVDGGVDGGAGGDGGGSGGSGPGVDPTLGGPCVDDGQCDDALACTHDACDLALGRCRFTPDDAPCQNTLYCD